MATERVVLWMADLAGGGAERVMVNIANGLADRGHAVEMILARASGPYAPLLDGSVTVRELGRRLSYCAAPFVRQVRAAQPCCVLAAGEHACAIAALAKRFHLIRSRLVLTVHNAIRPSASAPSCPWKDRINPYLVRNLYGSADRTVAVSADLCAETRSLMGSAGRVVTIYNPLVSDVISGSAAGPAGHPWLDCGSEPVVLGVGRLCPQKDFATLLYAFALLRRTVNARLVILGEGPEREALSAEAGRLGIAEEVHFAGFVSNPYSWMKRAAVLALSSRFEGFGNVLVEAMAVGTPVVSTRCPHGPREILDGGRFGKLAPVGDAAALAGALAATISARPNASILMQRAQEFSTSAAIRRYEQVLGLSGSDVHVG